MSLTRILDANYSRYLAGALACLGHILLGILAWQGAKFSLTVLVIVAVYWTLLATYTGIRWRSTLSSWEETLDTFDETSKLAGDYASLLVEACDRLSTWDQDEAMNIVGRASTIGKLRQMNYDERSKE